MRNGDSVFMEKKGLRRLKVSLKEKSQKRDCTSKPTIISVEFKLISEIVSTK